MLQDPQLTDCVCLDGGAYSICDIQEIGRRKGLEIKAVKTSQKTGECVVDDEITSVSVLVVGASP